MKHESISSDEQLRQYCDRLAAASSIAFDTEFVSEDTYRPQLCLVQVATDEGLAVIDPLTIDDMTPFWQVLSEGEHETIVHAGREELLFSLSAVGTRPTRLFDTQIAAGLVGFDYPAGYASLIGKLLGKRPPKGETRTDWRRRPLSKHQIHYALSDVLYLMPVRDTLYEKLHALDRIDWLAEEMEAWQQEIEGFRTRQRWRKVSGISGLSQQGLAIVRELWKWREKEAQRLNRPPKRVLRDDLIAEMAKRGSPDPKRISAIRGIDRGNLKRSIPDFAECISRALDIPAEQMPQNKRRDMPPQLNVLGQFLTAALTSICRTAQVAPSIVGTASDVRELVAWQLGFGDSDPEEPPVLATGWRATVVGNLIHDLLEGKKSIRISDPLSDHPLTFDG